MFTDLKPQIMIACLCLVMAVTMLSSVAVAASTRLGQVMTIVICFGVFVASLFSNYLVGRRVFSNQLVGTLTAARADDSDKPDFLAADSVFTVEFESPPRKPMPPGTFFYYGPSPSGYPLLGLGEYHQYTGDMTSSGAMSSPGVQPAIIVTDGKPPYKSLKVRNIGEKAVTILRPPAAGDYVFLQTTQVNRPALAIWGSMPNLQNYWLLDAISQNRPVSFQYLITTMLYTVAQIGVFLSLGVILFQRRDVG